MSKPPIIDDENSDEPARYHPPGGSQAGGPIMTEPKFTPGPWRIESGTTLLWGACSEDDLSSYGMGYPIAECRITPISKWPKGPNYDEGIANARLISAAPDMFEALLKGKEYTTLKRSDGEFDVKTIRAKKEYIKARDAALAKARGEA